MTNHEVSQQTKIKIAETLRSLMSTKQFSKITVSEIVNLCGINRKTFYYHFEDIYSLLRWMLEQETVAIIKTIDLNEDYPQAISFVLDYVEKNLHILNCALDSASGYTLHRFFVHNFMQISLSVIHRAERKYAVTLEPQYRDLVAEFYAEGVAGLLLTWIRHPQMLNRKQVEENIGMIIRDSLIGILTKEHE